MSEREAVTSVTNTTTDHSDGNNNHNDRLSHEEPGMYSHSVFYHSVMCIHGAVPLHSSQCQR